MILNPSEKEGLFVCVVEGAGYGFQQGVQHISLRRWWVERPEAGVPEQTLWKSRWRASQADRSTWTKVLMWELVKCLRKWKEVSVTRVEWGVVRIVASGDFTGDSKHFGFTLSWELIWGCCLGKKKKAQPISWELCFIQWTFLRLQAQETATQITLIAPKRQGGKQRYTEVFATKDQVVSLNEKIPDISN